MANRFLVVTDGRVTNVIVGQTTVPGSALIEQTEALRLVGIGWYRHADGSFSKTAEVISDIGTEASLASTGEE